MVVPGTVIGVFSAIMTSYLASIVLFYSDNWTWYWAWAGASVSLLSTLAYAACKGVAEHNARVIISSRREAGARIAVDELEDEIHKRYEYYRWPMWICLGVALVMAVGALWSGVRVARIERAGAVRASQVLSVLQQGVSEQSLQISELRDEMSALITRVQREHGPGVTTREGVGGSVLNEGSLSGGKD